MFRLGKKLEIMLLVCEKMDSGKEKCFDSKCCFSVENNYEINYFCTVK